MITPNDQPDYLGHRERLRQRFLRGGGRDMPDYELLELVLTIAIPRRDVKPLAKKLIGHFGSFADVINADKEELMSFDGVKEATVTVFKIINVAAQRTSWQHLASDDAPIITKLDDLIDYCRSSMCYSDVEEMRLIYLDARLQVLGEEIMQRGTINRVAVHPREVIKLAIQHHAAALIMVHNHPSGDVRPSAADKTMTLQLSEACKTMGVRLMDHLIVSRSDAFSFKEHNLLHEGGNPLIDLLR